MAIKLVALDIDGTLLDSYGNLPTENGRAIEESVQRGVKVILVSGRRWSMARQVSAALGLTFPVVAHNGALIRSPIDSRRLASCFLKPGLAAEILAYSQDHFSYLVLHRDQDFNGQTVIHPTCRKNVLMQGYLGQFPEAVMETESLLPWADTDLIQIMFGGELPAILKLKRCFRSERLVEKSQADQNLLSAQESRDHRSSGQGLLEAHCFGVSSRVLRSISRRDTGDWRQSQ